MKEIISSENQVGQLADLDATQELTGVRGYNPDLDMMESAWIDAQYNELINCFAL